MRWGQNRQFGYKGRKIQSIQEEKESNNKDDSKEVEEITNFFRRLKPRIDKYKGKLPLIFFNFDGIGHFANKFPHKKKKRNEEDEAKMKQLHKGKRYKNNFFKKSFCTKEDNSSLDEDEVNDSDTERVLFMEIENSNEEGSDEEESEKEYEEAEFNLMEELISAIEVIKKEKKKNKML
jgi:hypothetical protein